MQMQHTFDGVITGESLEYMIIVNLQRIIGRVLKAVIIITLCAKLVIVGRTCFWPNLHVTP